MTKKYFLNTVRGFQSLIGSKVITGRGTVLCPARCLSGFREVSYFFEQVLVLNGCLQWTKLVLHKTIPDIKIHTRYAGILPAYLSKIIILTHCHTGDGDVYEVQ